MSLLLTESLDPVRRELTHQHIESCAECTAEWEAYRETWSVLDELPAVEPPSRVRERFLAQVYPAALEKPETRSEPKKNENNVVPFHRRQATKWVAQAAAVVVLVGGSYFAGQRTSTTSVAANPQTEARVTGVSPNAAASPFAPASYSIAETRVMDASSLSPNIEGRPDISNVQFTDPNPNDDSIGVSFDITSRWTVNGSPNDKGMVRLLSYVLENEGSSSPRSGAIDWVRRTYSSPQYAHPEIADALAKVLRSDEHEGVRINAVDTLKTLPSSSSSSEQTREALIAALKSDPNPAVRIKAVEALARLAANGEQLGAMAVDTLRQKATQDDENVYVRVKAAEALSNIKP